MLKRIAVVVSLTVALLLGFGPRDSVHSNVLTEAELAIVSQSANNEGLQAKKNGGNRLVRVIAFPFKAIGRLFGRGGNKDDNKFHRLSQKDVKKFETAKISRVTDALSTPAAPTNEGTAPASASSVTELSHTLNADQALAREYLKDARLLLEKNDTNGAIAALTRAVSLDSKLYEAHNLLGIAYESKGIRNLALESLEASLKGDRDQAEHLNDYGYLLMKNGNYARAIKYLKRAVKTKPDEQRFLNNLGLAQAEAGKFGDAYKSFERAVGEFEGRLNVATRLQRMGYDKEAIKHLEKARALQPNSMDILGRLVVLYGRVGKPDEAAAANQTLISLRTTADVNQP
jgi:tetratricopeptide (TPR) repeat protein